MTPEDLARIIAALINETSDMSAHVDSNPAQLWVTHIDNEDSDFLITVEKQ